MDTMQGRLVSVRPLGVSRRKREVADRARTAPVVAVGGAELERGGGWEVARGDGIDRKARGGEGELKQGKRWCGCGASCCSPHLRWPEGKRVCAVSADGSPERAQRGKDARAHEGARGGEG